jgi:glycosyltransferase involved in cell wall biosynthesis
MDNASPFSIIVCAHDEEQNLRELIPVLLQQQYSEFEIVVVDDRSNDGTYDYLRELTMVEPRVRMVQVKHKPDHVNGKKYALTLGVKAARYEWLLLTDADCRPATDKWIESFSKYADGSTQIILGYSPYNNLNGLLNLFIRFETLLTAVQYIGFALGGNPYMGVGRNLAYRKSLFLNNKGFNGFLEVTGGDDDLFVNQHARGANTKVNVGSSSLVVSVPKKSWSQFFQQKIRHLSVGKYYRFKHKFLLGMFTTSFITTWFLGLPLLFLSDYFYAIALVLAFRITLFAVTVYVASSRLGNKFDSWVVPLLDFLFAIYYISTGPIAFLTKKVRWKT